MASDRVENEKELTSTVGDVLSTSTKEEKGDTSDAIPTSSTDASTAATTPHLVSDDPISSTSSELDQNKSAMTQMSGVIPPEDDLLGISITNMPNEKITEDVEDLVHDLESLLEGPFPVAQQGTRHVQQEKTSIEESKSKKKIEEVDIQSSDNFEAQHVVVENIENISNEVACIGSEGKLDLEEDKADSVDNACELVDQNTKIVEKQREVEVGKDVADCSKQDATNLIEDAAEQWPTELNKNTGICAELAEAHVEADGPSDEQVETAATCENVEPQSMEHDSDSLGVKKDTIGRVVVSELEPDIHEQNQTVGLQSEEIVKSVKPQDIDKLVVTSEGCVDIEKEVSGGDQTESDVHLSIKTDTLSHVIDEERNDIPCEVEGDQVPDEVAVETLMEDVHSADESVKTVDNSVTASVVDTEDQQVKIHANDNSPAVDDLVEASVDSEDPKKIPLNVEAPKTDINKKEVAEVSTAIEDFGDKTIELSLADQNATVKDLVEPSVDEKNNDCIIEIHGSDTATIVDSSEASVDNAQAPATEILAGDKCASTKNVDSSELRIFKITADVSGINYPLETDTDDNVTEVQQIDDVTSIDNTTIESTTVQAEYFDSTKLIQIEEEREKEETMGANVVVVRQDSEVTAADEVQDDTTVDIPVVDVPLQHETEIEEVAVETEQTGEVRTQDKEEDIENVSISETTQLEASLEPAGHTEACKETVSEDVIESALEANQNRIAKVLPDESDITKETAEDETMARPVEDELPNSVKAADGVEKLAVDEVIEHKTDCDTEEDITEVIANEPSLVEPTVPIEESQTDCTEVSEECNTVIPMQQEAVAESICVEKVEVAGQAEEIQTEYLTRNEGDVVENASPSAEVEQIIDEEIEAAVDALGVFIDGSIEKSQTVILDKDTSVPNNDDVECVESVENNLQCATDTAILIPEDETEAAVKSLNIAVLENVDTPSSILVHESNIMPEYEETEAAVAALTCNELPYHYSPNIPEEPIICPDKDAIAAVNETTTTVVESHSTKISDEFLIVEDIVGDQKTAGTVQAMLNTSNEVEGDVVSDIAEPEECNISDGAIAAQNDEAVNEEETRAAVEAVMSLTSGTHDENLLGSTSEADTVSYVEISKNKDKKDDSSEMVAIDVTSDEKLPVSALSENNDVEAITIPILEAGDYKSPKSVGGATAMSFESEEEMEALALEPDESPPAIKTSPLPSIEEVEEPEEKESQQKSETLRNVTEETEALKNDVDSITVASKDEGITAETIRYEVNTGVVRDSDAEKVVENNVSEVKVSKRSEKSVEATKEVLTVKDINDTIIKGSREMGNFSQSIEAESSENSTIKEKETKKINERPRRGKKVIPDSKLGELSINVDLPEKEKPYSPKVTIKPIKVPDDEISTTSNSDLEVGKGCLKMTITKQSDNTHSILKICDSESIGAETAYEEGHIPKLRIKSIMPPAEQHSPKSKNKQTYSPTGSTQRSSSPRVTIKPVLKPEVSPLKIKIGLKGDEGAKRASPKMNIKGVIDDECSKDSLSSPKKAKSDKLAKVVEDVEQLHSPRITIKPIPKPEVEVTRLRLKMHEDDENIQERSSPKITIKPLVKPQETEDVHDDDEGAKERIVLKINKGNLPAKDEKSEKLAKITLKLSKEGGAHIVQQPEENQKRPNEEPVVEKNKKQKTDLKQHSMAEPVMETRSRHKETDSVAEASKFNPTKHKDLTESPVDAKRTKLSPSPARDVRSRSKEVVEPEERELKILNTRIDSPILISEDSRSQDSGSCIIIEDTITPDSERRIEFEIADSSEVTSPHITPTPRKRGRPKKRKPADTMELDPLHQLETIPAVPLAAKQTATSKQIAASKQAALAKQANAAKAASKNVALPGTEPSVEVAVPVQALHESGRPKRSCRGQSAIDVLGIKPRKPRQPNASGSRGGGRGGKRGAAEVRNPAGALEKDSHKEHKTPDATDPHCPSRDLILVKDLEVVVPAVDRNKTELKLQQVGKNVVELPQKETSSADLVQGEWRSAEPPLVEREPLQKLRKTEDPVHKIRKGDIISQVGKQTVEPSLREKRSERRSVEPLPKNIEPLQKEEKPAEFLHKKRKSTEGSPKEAKQVESQHKLSKATETTTKRGASFEHLGKDAVTKLEEPPHKQSKIIETTETPLKEVSVALQQKQGISIEPSSTERTGQLQREVGPDKHKNFSETEPKLKKEGTSLESTHEQNKDPLEDAEADQKIVQEKNLASLPPRKLSIETPKRPGGPTHSDRKSFPFNKPMLIDEIIDLDPDPPEPPKIASVEIEVRPVEVRLKQQVARRGGGRRGIGTRRPTTERRVETTSEVEEKSSSAETTPLPSPKPHSEKSSTLAPQPEVPTLEMPLPELTVHVTNIAPVLASTSASDDVIMVDEETRMSADTNSRAQTPAKQVVSEIITIEESQSCSVQSTGNNSESSKTPSIRSNKAPRLEVQENESTSGISSDQLTEYYWNGNGPFMLQEQVAQYLGIKSFKRKYPGIMRRALDMQERDYIREKGLASDHMCDLGLTAVNSVDILDIMYADFQDKYEDYCKNLRDRQAKELINKQRALSLAASHEKSKADITTQAVQSAAQWNANFNKTRKEQRRACMDLQTLTVHYPKGRLKPILKPKVGNYPVSLVPGQFTDYFKEFTPTEINNLPLNTMLYEELHRIPPDDSDDSGSESDSSSDSDSSSSSSSSDSSSGVEDCKLCKHSPQKKSPNANSVSTIPTTIPIPATAAVPVTK